MRTEADLRADIATARATVEWAEQEIAIAPRDMDLQVLHRLYVLREVSTLL